MTSSEDSTSQPQALPSDAAGEAEDKIAASSSGPTDASKSETITAPAITSTATATTGSAPETPNASTLTARTLPTAPKTAPKMAPATNSTGSATKMVLATDSTPSITTKPESAPTTSPIAILKTPEDGIDDRDSSSESSLDDEPVEMPAAKETFIAVMGQTGAGKSKFINFVTGADLKVGHGLTSCTSQVQPASTVIEGRAVTLIDTPGFDDTIKLEGEIINLIAAYLRLSYNRKDLLSGVIFLHRITDVKVGAASRRTMTLLQKMCGANNFEKIALVTTRWDELREQKVGEDRENELETEDVFWGPMIAKKAKTFRHFNTKETAVEIVKEVIQNNPIKLKMQKQLSPERASVAGTTAGKYIAKELLKERKGIEENPESIISPQEITERIDKDVKYMQVPVEDLFTQARAFGAESEGDGATVPREIAKDNGAPETSDKSPPEKPFLQKLFDMIKWMGLR